MLSEGLGRQDRDAHHGPARLHQPAALRAGGGPRPAPHRLRGRTRTPGCSSRNTSTSSACPSPSCRTKAARMARRRRRRPRPPIEPDPARRQFEIRWPNVIRIDHVFRPMLSLDWAKVDAAGTECRRHRARLAELAPVLEGKPDVSRRSTASTWSGWRASSARSRSSSRRRATCTTRCSTTGRAAGSAAGAAGAPGGAVHPLRQDRHSPAAVLPGRPARAGSSSRST